MGKINGECAFYVVVIIMTLLFSAYMKFSGRRERVNHLGEK